MKKSLILSLLLSAVIVTAPAVLKAEPTAPPLSTVAYPEIDDSDFMKPKDVRRGMICTAYTVFQGTEIKPFKIEILGTNMVSGSQQVRYMIKIIDPLVNDRKMGVVAGMSGSPVYYNGKLLGAISHCFTNSKEALGMVTSIYNMTDSWNPSYKTVMDGYSTPIKLAEPVTVDGKKIDTVEIVKKNEDKGAAPSNVLRAVEAPMVINLGGFSDKAASSLAETLKSYNVECLTGFAEGANDYEKAPFIDSEFRGGAPIGTAYMIGDFFAGGTGTLTYRKGNKILAFGHAADDIGATCCLMTTAYIMDIIPKWDFSTKTSVAGEPIGIVNMDRQWAIAGVIGEYPKLIPLKFDVENVTTKRRKVFNCKVIDHPILTYNLVSAAISSAIDNLRPDRGYTMADVTFTVKADKVGAITYSDRYYSDGDISSVAAGDFDALLLALSRNPVLSLDLQGVDVKVTLTNERNIVNIDRVFVDKNTYKPGETIKIGAVLKKPGGATETKHYEVKVPVTASDNQATVALHGGMSALNNTDGANLGKFETLDEVVRNYKKRNRNDEMVAELVTKDIVPTVKGQQLIDLPEHINDIVRSNRVMGIKQEPTSVKSVYKEDSVIYGAAAITIKIAKDEAAKPAAAAAAPAPAAPQQGENPYKTVRSVSRKTDKTFADFMKGTPEGLAVNTKKGLVSSVKIDESAQIENRFAWAVLPVEGGVLTAGEGGKIIKVSESGQGGTFFDTGAAMVFDLAKTSDGTVYAGTSPEGKVYKISPNGEGKVVLDMDGCHVTALTVDGKNNVYAACGDTNVIYKIAPDGSSRKFAEITGERVLALGVRGDDILCGTGKDGAVCAVDEYGKVTPLIDSLGAAVTALSSDEAGNVYAATAGKGKVLKIAPDGFVEGIFGCDKTIYDLTECAGGVMYAVGEGFVEAVCADGSVSSPTKDFPAVRFISAALTPSGTFYAGSADNASLYKGAPTGGEYVSGVFDSGDFNEWRKVTTVGKGDRKVFLRTGNIKTPDDTWSDWREVAADGSVSVPVGRYGQYKVVAGTGAEISSVTFDYIEKNRAPKINVVSPDAADVWAGKRQIKWTGVDSEGDPILYDVYVSADGNDWKKLNGDKIDGTTFDWEIRDLPDGTYMIKVVGDDSPVNGVNALTGEGVSAPFTVTSKVPVIKLHKNDISEGKRILARAESELCDILVIRYKIDNKRWMACEALDGLFDSGYENFAFTMPTFAPGKHKIEVQAIDAYGNMAVVTAEIEKK
ncbi:MAG: hypothetical protein IJT09_00810 [Abditibacteriota bacterium]|nr:hypothetical protein [Abditibacteriota bacterium]